MDQGRIGIPILGKLLLIRNDRFMIRILPKSGGDKINLERELHFEGAAKQMSMGNHELPASINH